MKFNLGLGTRPSVSPNPVGQSSSGKDHYGRVVDVILSMSHPRVNSLGGTQALYGLFYQPLFTVSEEDLDDNYPFRFAYCGKQTLRQIPIKGEIVRLEPKLTAVDGEVNFESDGDINKVYWTEIVPLWNTPHLSAYPDIPNHPNPDYGAFVENSSIKPLQLNTGDVTLEGRHGQTLRFGGTKSDISPIATEDTNGKPYTILRNGQAPTEEDTCFEDINKDDSSIYLTSDHRVPIIEANRRFRGAVEIPEVAKNYQGKQIVANSDRVVVNAREDNLTLAAKKHASINADTTSIDGEQYVGLDAKKVYLGSFAQKEQEPVLKGQVSIDFLKDFYNILYSWFQMQGLALGSMGSTGWEKAAATQTTMVATQLQSLFAGIDRLKSKKVYTE